MRGRREAGAAHGLGPRLPFAVGVAAAVLAGCAAGCAVPGDEVYGGVDEVAPALLAVVPVGGAEEVPPEARIHIAFSEPVLAETVVVRLSSGPLETVALPSAGDASARPVLVPRSPLVPGVVWTARLDGGASDRTLNPLGEDVVWQFRTGAPAEPFSVLGVTPPEGAVDVPVDVRVNVALSHDVHEAMLSADSVRLETLAGVRVSARVTLEPPGAGQRDDTLRVTPTRDLARGTGYILTVSADLVDLSARRLGEPFVSRFSTEP